MFTTGYCSVGNWDALNRRASIKREGRGVRSRPSCLVLNKGRLKLTARELTLYARGLSQQVH